MQMSVGVFIILLGIYLSTLHPSLPGGDSGELLVTSYSLGVPHPPGYPLFALLSKLAMTVFPWCSLAARVNLLTAILSALAGALLQLTVLKMTRDLGTSLMAVGLFSLGRLTWSWSVAAEVFALNNFLLSALICLMVVFELHVKDGEELGDFDTSNINRVTLLGSFVGGLCLCNQHTAVVYVACTAAYVVYTLRQAQLLSLTFFFKIAFFFILGLSPYLYVPLSSAYSSARWSWGDQTTLHGFLMHLMRSEYGTFDLGKGTVGPGLVHYIRSYLVHCHEEMYKVGLPLASFGAASIVLCRCKSSGSAFTCFVMLTIYIVLFSWRANLDITNPMFVGVVERFWLQADLVIALLAGYGYHPMCRWVTKKVLGEQSLPMSAGFTMFGAVILCAVQSQLSYWSCDQSQNYVVREFAVTMLKKLPQNSIILTHGDLPSNSLRYFHDCEDFRPDVTIVDVEMLSYAWFVPKHKNQFPNITFPGDIWQLQSGRTKDGRQAFNYKSFLDANYPRAPLFACIGMADRESSWKESYTLWPYGPCHRVVSLKEPFRPSEWSELTGSYSDEWKYPYNKFPETSWEKVANDEMWAAKIGTAFFMYSQADKIKEPTLQAELLQHAYHLYFEAIKKNQKASRMDFKQDYPAFWHKNFALVCERLLHVETNLKKSQLCKLSISHFELYIHQTSDSDDDLTKIQQVIDVLRQRLDVYAAMDNVDSTLKSAGLNA